MTIHMAACADAQALRDIYKPYVDTPVTFEEDVPSVDEFERRIDGIIRTYPYLVCVQNGCPIGYAYAHRFRERPAYRWGAELSVYISGEHQGKGVGKALYTALIDLLKEQGVKNVYASVTLPNEKSEGLHRSLGFRTAGIYHHTGYKCGKWHDVLWLEREIGECGGAPAEVIPITQLDSARIRNILGNAERLIR